MRRLALTALLLVGGVLVGCGAGAGREALQDAVRTFNSQVRWARWGGAAQFVAPDLRAEWLASRTAHGSALRITDLQVHQVNLEGDGTEATVMVGINWYMLPTMNVQFTAWKQSWKLLEGHWTMTEEVPVKADAPKPEVPVQAWP